MRAGRFAASALGCALLVAAGIAGRSHGQTPAAQNPSSSRADDVVMARQQLMDGIEQEMGALETALDGREPNLSALKSRAYTIYTMMSAFPHLFPADGRPAGKQDDAAVPTAAGQAVWDEFDAFYARVQAGAAAAFDASQAADLEQIKRHARVLREACDSCHERYMQAPPP